MAELATQLNQPLNGSLLKPPPPGQAELQLLKFLDGLDEESLRFQKDRLDQWQVSLNLFKGKIWPVQDKAPMFLVNALAPLVDKQTALLSDAKPIIRIMARRLGLETTATILQKTLMAGWDEYNMYDVMDTIGYNLNLFSAAFMSVTWNPLAAYGQGDLEVTAIDPRKVRFDPAITQARDLHKAQYLIQDSIVPLWEVWRLYPGRGQLVTPNISFAPTHNRQQRHGLKAFLQSFVSSSTEVAEGAVPRVHLRRYWFHDPTINAKGEPLYPAGRTIVRNGEGDIILEDRANYYWDNAWPLVMCDGKYDPDSPWGRPEILAYQRLQEAINRIGHMFVENTILGGNIWVTADNDALEPSLLQKLSNLGAVVIRKRFGRTVERSEPPQMPPHFLEFIKLALSLINELSGVTDSTVSGRGRIELRSGEQLEGLQFAAETLVRALARRIESFLERFGRLWVSRIFQYYTSDRLLTYLGPNTEWQSYNFERQELIKELIRDLPSSAKEPDILKRLGQAHQAFLFRIIPGSSLSSVRMARARAFAELAQQNMLSRVKVLEEMGFPNPEAEIDRAIKEQQMLNPGPPAPASSAQSGGARTTPGG